MPTGRDFTHDRLGHGCYALDLDDRVHAFTESIRDALIAQGVLCCDRAGVWRLAWHGFDLEAHRAAWMACCDFCTGRPVAWNLPCAAFDCEIPPAPRFISPGDWAACDPCGRLVITNAREALLARAAHVLGNSDAVRLLHRLFWQHYQGGAAAVPRRAFGH